MSAVYADTSALVRAYFPDEEDHEYLRNLLLEGREPVVTSEITRVELASAIVAAFRDGRLDDRDTMLLRVDADCSDEGPIAVLRLDSGPVLEVAYDLVKAHRLRALDAIHLAVAAEVGPRLDPGGIAFITRDRDQAAAASELGFTLR